MNSKTKYFIIILAITVLIIAGTMLIGIISANNVESSTVFVDTTSETSTETTNEKEVIDIEVSTTTEDTSTGSTTDTNTQEEAPVEEVIIEDPTITSSDLSTHGSQDDCWVGFDGKVYDITSYLTRHPGGVSKISKHCGTTQGFENAFAREHGTSQVSKFMQIAVYIGDAHIK
ncbi:cytochrome b5 domain-containing protein [archaeon]|jgi:cytochrome b involved in lipid metabolism|nr:cytochrome b5 domain-containing protein [archaeon]MBT6698537.1 cytochrome b5 domain-containing protein [archaeon]